MRGRLRLAAAFTMWVVAVAACGAGTDQPSDESTPSSMTLEQVTVSADLVYASEMQGDRTVDWKLDVYRGDEAADAPVVVLLHGQGEGKTTFASLSRALAERGVTVFAVSYDAQSPGEAIGDNADGFRAMVDRAACAIRFARGSDVGSETGPVVLLGFSAGGGVAAHAALAGERLGALWEEYGESGGGPASRVHCEVSGASTHVDALVGVSGSYDAFVGYDEKYGREFILENEPDLLEVLYGVVGRDTDLEVRLLHGEVDYVVPSETSRAFEALLTDAGYDAELTLFAGGHDVPVDLTVETVMDLLAE